MLQTLQTLASSGCLRFLEVVDKEEDWIGVNVGVDVSTRNSISTVIASSDIVGNLTTDGLFLHLG